MDRMFGRERFAPSENWYDVEQICLNGHVINRSTKNNPDHCQLFCDKCGAETIKNCPNCKNEIQGEYHVEGVVVVGFTESPPPAFCLHCGEAFPWTKLRIESAIELANEIENITDEDKVRVTESIELIVRDTPQTTLAATRFKKITAKTGEVFIKGFRDLLIDIASETAKKIIWPNN